ncbi:MAG TPA: hypothetical protein VFX30_12485 [bacterium]|nr:hypothetical protein [bacterium]
MVSGVWNQLLFLGNRIDGFVRAGAVPAALPSAHLALNLLQHSCGDDRAGLGTSEADHLRRLLSDGQTQTDALQRLIALTRGGEGGPPSVPTLWRSDPSRDSRTRKLLWTWRQALGTALFQVLRYRHTRFSPTGQSPSLLFRIAFHPREGLLQSIQLPHFFPESALVPVSEEEAHAFFSYSPDAGRFYLKGFFPKVLAVSGTERRVTGECEAFPDLSPIGEEVRGIVSALHGSVPVFPDFKTRRRNVDGAVVVDIEPALHKSNARYARKVLPHPDDDAMGMTMTWSTEMARAVKLGLQDELQKLMPVAEIFISVADNGAFMGFVYQLAEKHSPRGTVYEIGSPQLGVRARLLYEVYQAEPGSDRKCRVPTGIRWLSKPNRHQKRAVERWIAGDEFKVIRNSWISVSKSD